MLEPNEATVKDMHSIPVDFPVAATSLRHGRRWVPPTLMVVDLLALLMAMFLALEIRFALGAWLPNEIGEEQYLQLFYGLLAMPVGYALAGLYPGYGLHPVERLRRRTLVTTLIFVLLIA